MRLLCLFLLLFATFNAIAQPAQKKQETPPLNQTDKEGRRQGLWWLDVPERMGEPASTQFGPYSNNVRTGVWYTMDQMGEMMAVERYRNDVLDGEVKYFDRGALITIGHYRGLNPAYEYDTIIVTDPVSGAESPVVLPTERGTVKHGIWRYYNPNTGQLVREDEYQVDELIHQEVFQTPADSSYIHKRDAMLDDNMKRGGTRYKPGHQYRPIDK